MINVFVRRLTWINLVDYYCYCYGCSQFTSAAAVSRHVSAYGEIAKWAAASISGEERDKDVTERSAVQQQDYEAMCNPPGGVSGVAVY